MILSKPHFLSLIVLSLYLPFTLYANNNQNDGETWLSENNNPPVTVTIQDDKVWAKTWNTLPAIELRTINSDLLDQYKADYVQIKDFNLDGATDVGILDGVGYGGSDKCYSVHEYDASNYVFSAEVSFTACP